MAPRLNEISPRSREILATYARLGSQDEAAAVLGVHKQTVKNHLLRIKETLGAKSTIQAVWWLLDGDDAVEVHKSSQP